MKIIKKIIEIFRNSWKNSCKCNSCDLHTKNTIPKAELDYLLNYQKHIYRLFDLEGEK